MPTGPIESFPIDCIVTESLKGLTVWEIYLDLQASLGISGLEKLNMIEIKLGLESYLTGRIPEKKAQALRPSYSLVPNQSRWFYLYAFWHCEQAYMSDFTTNEDLGI